MDDYKLFKLGLYFNIKNPHSPSTLGTVNSITNSYYGDDYTRIGLIIQGFSSSSYTAEQTSGLVPIPLTKDILEVSEFETQDNTTYYSSGICISSVSDEKWNVDIKVGETSVHTCIKYIHELQLLYLTFFNQSLSLKFGDLKLILEDGESKSQNQ